MGRETTILVIEDEADFADILKVDLEHEGFQVAIANDGETGLKQATSLRPSLIILDLGLPDMSGLEVCRLLKQSDDTRALPVIFLSGRDDESDIALGLGLGGEDYIVKPPRPKEMMARVRAALRRTTHPEITPSSKRIESGPVQLDQSRFEVKVDGQVVQFTLAEFTILWTLASRPGQVFTRDQLVQKITKGDAAVIDRTIDVHINAIRKKLAAQSTLVETVRGIGYRFKDTFEKQESAARL